MEAWEKEGWTWITGGGKKKKSYSFVFHKTTGECSPQNKQHVETTPTEGEPRL